MDHSSSDHKEIPYSLFVLLFHNLCHQRNCYQFSVLCRVISELWDRCSLSTKRSAETARRACGPPPPSTRLVRLSSKSMHLCTAASIIIHPPYIIHTIYLQHFTLKPAITIQYKYISLGLRITFLDRNNYISREIH